MISLEPDCLHGQYTVRNTFVGSFEKYIAGICMVDRICCNINIRCFVAGCSQHHSDPQDCDWIVTLFPVYSQKSSDLTSTVVQPFQQM